MNVSLVRLGLIIGAVAFLVVGGCGDDAEKFSITLYDSDAPAGYLILCWDQQDTDGNAVKPGQFQVSIRAGDFEGAGSFGISSTADAVSAPNCGSAAKVSGVIPEEFSVQTNSSVYRVGDIIQIDCGLPVACLVKVTITRRSGFGSSIL